MILMNHVRWSSGYDAVFHIALLSLLQISHLHIPAAMSPKGVLLDTYLETVEVTCQGGQFETHGALSYWKWHQKMVNRGHNMVRSTTTK